ncbi:uncharacterized protein LOC114726732 [Neltuma alba]|uniref:uncharacterized protein LOC114726732 n=1 Tax=Neltuma alba TaxID=207710 RepID=UPI0010A30F0E|nr:uncharacterized protein LOC114726732 [Prosopis alba]
MNLRNNFGNDLDVEWNIMWGLAIWKLWQWRNEFIFNSDFHKPRNPALFVLNMWSSFAGKKVVENQPVIKIHWQLPPPTLFKLNFDGAKFNSSQLAACGGLICDHEGTWGLGFSYYLGICSPHEAEEWGILKGLNLAIQMGFNILVVESDNQNLIHSLTNWNSHSTACLTTPLLSLLTEVHLLEV